MTLRLRTFGAVYLERHNTQLGGAHAQRRRLGLLAYLAASGRNTVTRDRLVALFWPEGGEAGGRHALSQLIYAIRRDLGIDAIVADSATVSLNHDVIASDVNEFHECMQAGEFERAADVYRGAFLDGFYVDEAPELGRWVERERARRSAECARALERLAEEAERCGDAYRASEWWRRRVALTPADSRATLRLLRSLAAMGDRLGAVQAARVYEALVRQYLEADPDPAVLALADQLRIAEPPPTAPATSQAGDIEPSKASQSEAGLEPAPAIMRGGQPVRADVIALSPAPARPRAVWRVPVAVALAAGVLLVVAVTQARDRSADRSTTGSLTAVVLGDFGGADSVLAFAVREALRAELSNAPGIRLTSDLRLRGIRSLMGLPVDSALPPRALLEVATRSGAHVAISGSVVPIGAGAQIVLDLHDPSSGRTLATLAERPSDAAGFMAAIERLGRSLRAAVLRAPIDTMVRPLPAVTTTSLAALKSYALARQAIARGNRVEALRHGERAVTHDSSFVLAHYFVGDLLWFMDQQSHAEAHLTRAYELSEAVPMPERLAVRARYLQLVRDRPDSALAHWDLFRDAAPAEALGYEGRSWALRALGRYEEATAAADTAMLLDPDALLPNVNNVVYSMLSVADTAGALAFTRELAKRTTAPNKEARFWIAMDRGEARAALAIADSFRPHGTRNYRRLHAALLARDSGVARRSLDSVRVYDGAQELPRALLAQGWVDVELAGDRRRAAAYAREALDWVRRRDLSPPAVARLCERIGDLAARAGDTTLVADVLALVRERDAGRSLPSYALAQRTLAAAAAFARRDMAEAARLAASARNGVYFSRSMTTVALLQADALFGAGDRRAADSVYRVIDRHAIADGDFEAAYLLRGLARQRGQPSAGTPSR